MTMRIIAAIYFMAAAAVAFGEISPSPARRDPGEHSRRVALFERIRPLTFNERFDRAHAEVDNYQSQFPTDPAGWLAKSSVYLAEMTAAEDDSTEQEFQVCVDWVLARTTEAEDSCIEDAAMFLMMRGHAYTYRALFEAKFGSKISAVKRAYNAKGAYEKGLECDSSRYDIYFGLGSFHYWKSAKAGVLRRVRIFSNDMKRGINELHLAIDSSEFSGEAATNALMWVLLDRREFDSALVICTTLATRYPEGRMFDWPRGEILYEAGRYEEAEAVYEDLRSYYLTNPGNYFNLIECEKKVVRCYEEREMETEAAGKANRFFEYENNIPEKTLNRQDDNIRYLKWWARKLDFD